jgi:hypothetical protein
MPGSNRFWWVVHTAVFIFFFGCRSKPAADAWPGWQLQHECNNQLTRIIVHDIISPPVASRMYAYCHLAYYEALRLGDSGRPSFAARLHGFGTMPSPSGTEPYNFRVAAAVAFFSVAEALVFSKDSAKSAMQKVLAGLSTKSKQEEQCSVKWGKAVAAEILKRAEADGYRQTRGMPRYGVLEETGKWKQTPPDYMDATEPYWSLILPLAMDSASACKPPSPPAYSSDSSSIYYKELKTVYQLSKSLSTEQQLIARFWDDNPFVLEHAGHLSFASKKMAPVGHWMGITGILCGQYAAKDEGRCAAAYAVASVAIFDGFISCWEEKYTSRTVRPVTVIREWIDPLWEPLLQTPSFPEYTSGHSVVSAAAAEVLSSLFGDVPFHDTTELPYLDLERRFQSPRQAAAEAGMSRIYGGIHFPSANEEGKKQGIRVGQKVWQRLHP